jgi:glycosyltransferase involved in cell wall biosynthesis
MISVVLPVYHNRRHLPELHARLSAALLQLASEYALLLVDALGGDGPLEWIRAPRADDAHVVLVEMPVNSGQHQAVLSGLAAARGEVVAVMDADLQDPPEALSALIAALDSNVDVVFARRATRHQSRGRQVTGRLFKHFVRALAKSRIPSGTGMYFVARRTAVDAALARAAGAQYVPLVFDQTGARMTAIDVVKHQRPDASSAYTAARRLRLAVAAVRQAWRWRRARTRMARASSDPGAEHVGEGQPLARQQHGADGH